MSGGSHDYFYRRMEQGDFQLDAYQLDSLRDSLQRYVDGVYRDGTKRVYEKIEGNQMRPFNEEERAQFKRDGGLPWKDSRD